MNRIRNSFYKHNWLKNLLNKNLAKSGLKKKQRHNFWPFVSDRRKIVSAQLICILRT